MQAALNVGTLERVEETPDGATLTYRPPEQLFPQWLYLILTRQGRMAAVRIPLHGKTLLPITTRARSTVRVKLGDQVVGPLPTETGRLKVPLLVAPGVDRAEVEVTDHTGLSVGKPVEIKSHPYRQLACCRSSREVGRSAGCQSGLPASRSSSSR